MTTTSGLDDFFVGVVKGVVLVLAIPCLLVFIASGIVLGAIGGAFGGYERIRLSWRKAERVRP